MQGGVLLARGQTMSLCPAPTRARVDTGPVPAADGARERFDALAMSGEGNRGSTDSGMSSPKSAVGTSDRRPFGMF